MRDKRVVLAMVGVVTAMVPMSVAHQAVAPSKPLGTYIYCMSYDNTIRTYRVKADGKVEPIGNGAVPAGGLASRVYVEPQKRFAYVANYSTGTISQYRILPDGSLKPLAIPACDTGPGPNGIAFDPSGRMLYVTMNYSKCLLQFRILRDGTLEPVPGAIRTGDSPTAIVTNRLKSCVYVLNRKGGFLSVYNIQKEGTLLPMKQDAVGVGDLLGDLALSSDGHTLYVSDDQTETLRQARINPDGSIGDVSVVLEGSGERDCCGASRLYLSGKQIFMTRPMAGRITCIRLSGNQKKGRDVCFDRLGRLNGLAEPEGKATGSSSFPLPAIGVDPLSGDVYFGGGESETSGILARYHSQGTPGYSLAVAAQAAAVAGGGKQNSSAVSDTLIQGGTVTPLSATPNYITVVSY